jgi:large subunit ribosomal protein L3
MTHISATETKKTSHLKGEEISIPVTILECPPMKIAGIVLYKKTLNGLVVAKHISFVKNDKSLARRLSLPKKPVAHELDKLNPGEYADARALVYTQPGMTGIGKKKPEIFEMGLGGSIADRIKYVKENAEKEIYVENVFKEGEYADLKSITKGKGFQGPVKRFGISLRQAKSEKSIRNPGSLGPWMGQGHIMWRVAHAGKMGYHQRTEYNKQIMKMTSDPKEVSGNGGILRYGVTKNKVLLIKGSVSGTKKRMIILQKPSRLKKTRELPTINSINLEQKQGN